jgi:hypothetical protein
LDLEFGNEGKEMKYVTHRLIRPQMRYPIKALTNGVLRYIELKSGYSDNGPAWIAYVMESKTGRTHIL